MSIRPWVGSRVRRVVMVTLAVAVASVIAESCAYADPGARPTQAGEQAARDAAVADVSAQLGKPARLDVTDLHTADGWAFVSAKILSPDGGLIDYRGTNFAEAAANGGVSKRYVGLLRSEAGQWRIVTSRVGPTDVAWENWSSEYGAPKSIFVTS